MKKGDIVSNITIETMASEGKCVAKLLDGRVLFLKGGAPGDIVEAKIFKVKSNYLEGIVTHVQQPSLERSSPFCRHFGTCGGCSWQHINYTTQLHYKQKQVKDNLERIGGLVLPVINPILGASPTQHYRNRLDFTFTAERWLDFSEFDKEKRRKEPGLGFHIPRKYDQVFDVEMCHLQPDPSNSIRLAVKDEAIIQSIPFFDLRKQVGFLRTLTIRNTLAGEVMVILQVAYDKMEWITAILQRLKRDFPQIVSLHYIINGKKNDTFHDLDIICWESQPHITEVMKKPNSEESFQFRIGPKTFFQTNSQQAESLYHLTWKLAQLTGKELVYDLYTGTGTIAAYISGQAKKVIGLEYVEASIHAAQENAVLNHIPNMEFYAGDMKDLLDEAFLQQHGKPDVVITDPPRAGMHEAVCRMLLAAAPQRIVYVSCNPATQARDLKILSELYQITIIQPVDMFPHTMHVENVVVLELRT